MVVSLIERKSMRYLIIGNGYLGKQFAQYFGDEAVLFHSKILSQEDMDYVIERYKPTYVINSAGKTGRPNIDWCEDHKQETFYSNVVLPTYILDSCQKYGAKMIHIGSGCVYQGDGGWWVDGGDGGYTEESTPNHDANCYSWTKIVSERFLKDHDVLQIRVRMPLNDKPDPRNLLTKLLKYDKVVEAYNSVTYIPDLMYAVRYLVEDQKSTGIFNVVNRGGIKHSEILKMYEEISGRKLIFESITPEELDAITKVPRSNCVLSTQKLRDAGLQIRSAKTAAETCIRNYIVSERSGSEKSKEIVV